MERDRVIAILRTHEPELRAAGVASVSLFGSVARGEATNNSDIDVIVRLNPEAKQGGFAYFGRLEALSRRLQEILDRPVDVVAEPVSRTALRENIEREALLAF